MDRFTDNPSTSKNRLQVGQQFSLPDGGKCNVGKDLGQGAESDVYLVELPWDGSGDGLAALKIGRRISANEYEKRRQSQSFDREAEVLRTLNAAEGIPQDLTGGKRAQRAVETQYKRSFIAILENGETSNGVPYILEELAGPPILNELGKFPAGTPQGRYIRLKVLEKIAEAMGMAHGSDITLSDVVGETKINKYRGKVVDSETTGLPEITNFKIIDLNGTADMSQVGDDILGLTNLASMLLFGRFTDFSQNKLMDFPVSAQLKTALASSGLEMPEYIKKAMEFILEAKGEGGAGAISKIKSYASAASQVEKYLMDFQAGRIKADKLGQYITNMVRALRRSHQNREIVLFYLGLGAEAFSDQPADLKDKFDRWGAEAQESVDKIKWEPLALARSTWLISNFEMAGSEFQQLVQRFGASEIGLMAKIYTQACQVGENLQTLWQNVREMNNDPLWNQGRQLVANLANKSERLSWDVLQSRLANWKEKLCAERHADANIVETAIAPLTNLITAGVEGAKLAELLSGVPSSAPENATYADLLPVLSRLSKAQESLAAVNEASVAFPEFLPFLLPHQAKDAQSRVEVSVRSFLDSFLHRVTAENLQLEIDLNTIDNYSADERFKYLQDLNGRTAKVSAAVASKLPGLTKEDTARVADLQAAFENLKVKIGEQIGKESPAVQRLLQANAKLEVLLSRTQVDLASEQAANNQEANRITELESTLMAEQLSNQIQVLQISRTLEELRIRELETLVVRLTSEGKIQEAADAEDTLLTERQEQRQLEAGLKQALNQQLERQERNRRGEL